MQKCPSLHPFSPPSLLPHMAFPSLLFLAGMVESSPSPVGMKRGVMGREEGGVSKDGAGDWIFILRARGTEEGSVSRKGEAG